MAMHHCLVALPGAVRLTGSKWNSEGRVEVLYNGVTVWGTVCSYTPWTLAEVQVVCSQLGYKEPTTLRSPPRSRYSSVKYREPSQCL